MNETITMVVTCLFGLESVLKFEISRIGGENMQVEDGRITYTGGIGVLVRSHLWLRTAERVLIQLGTFTATTFAQLFDEVALLPFEQYIGEEDAFPVAGWSLNSQLHSVPSCQSIIKRAVVRRFETAYAKETFAETGSVHQIRFSIYKDQVAIMLDTTGDPLYKRGYRTDTGLAPLRESLAAGIIDLARVRDTDTIYDPMCGSGTLLIEAAMRAMNLAPGLSRTFAMEEWAVSPPEVWQSEREKARECIVQNPSFLGIGYDNDKRAIKMAKANARQAGVAHLLQLSTQDITQFMPQPPSITICNPPYGERLLEHADAFALYGIMGTHMLPQKGNSYYIIGPSESFEDSFGRRADRRRKLYNGMIPCQLYMYFR